MTNRFLHLAAPYVRAFQPRLPGRPVETLESGQGVGEGIMPAADGSRLGPAAVRAKQP
jgi:hypothetical protein